MRRLTILEVAREPVLFASPGKRLPSLWIDGVDEFWEWPLIPLLLFLGADIYVERTHDRCSENSNERGIVWGDSIAAKIDLERGPVVRDDKERGLLKLALAEYDDVVLYDETSLGCSKKPAQRKCGEFDGPMTVTKDGGSNERQLLA